MISFVSNLQFLCKHQVCNTVSYLYFMYRSDLCDSTFPYEKCNSVYKNYFVEEAVRTEGLRFGEERLQDLCSDEAIVSRHCLSYCAPKKFVYGEGEVDDCQTEFSEASIE